MDATRAAAVDEGHLVGLLRRAQEALAEAAAHASGMADLEIEPMLEASELVGSIHRLSEAVVVRTVDAVQTQERCAAAESSLAARCGFRDGAGLLIALTGVSRPTLKRWQRLAQATSPRGVGSTGVLPPLLPHLAEALGAGLVSVDQAGVIRQHLLEASARARPEHLDVAERALVAAAVGLVDEQECGDPSGESLTSHLAALGDSVSLTPLSPPQLGTLARAWQAAIDPDGPEPTYDEQRRQRSFTLGRRSDGMWVGKLLLPPEQGETLRLALDAHNAPRAKARFRDDLFPTHAQDPDSVASEAPLADGPLGGRVDGPVSEGVDSERHDGFRTDSGSARLPRRGQVDDRTTAQRQADTLLGLLTSAMALGDAPTVGGSPAGLVVTISESELAEHAQTGGGTARLDQSGEIVPAHVAAKIICDGYLQGCVLNEDGLPLKLGRSRRLHTTHQRRAILTAYPGGCLNQYCDAPPGFTEIHHPVWWSNGGETDVTNGIPVCQHCHTEIHAGRLRCVQDSAGRWHLEPTLAHRRWRFGGALARAS
ncbi:DUF222 domain-containing protein [Pseudactinotalea sp.]|uniref:HNH endonuclease signature motif containing protein n=1 Tax=Pseudactinotalea sp. TaxID=1926260 RepID=UPI003B3A06D1